MKKIIASIAVVLIFVATLFVLNNRSGMAPVVTNTPRLTPSTSKTPTPTATPASGEIFEVLISENGLSKNNLTIKVGDAIMFTNNDTVLHWPASGPHPTHTLCPGFDSLRGLKQGETYSFTFNKAATCPFHDHINANEQYRGTITVTE
ncbi:MAG: S-layer protein [Parcubacteria group bacterium Gr01-1014_44]|nr:MAG: S-layer protein [Parcubacteria group bacterium Gr01-1014_44]